MQDNEGAEAHDTQGKGLLKQAERCIAVTERKDAGHFMRSQRPVQQKYAAGSVSIELVDQLFERLAVEDELAVPPGSRLLQIDGVHDELFVLQEPGSLSGLDGDGAVGGLRFGTTRTACSSTVTVDLPETVFTTNCVPRAVAVRSGMITLNGRAGSCAIVTAASPRRRRISRTVDE